MPRPEAKLCFHKQQLLEAFLQAVHEVVELQDQQMTHFVEGGGGFERIELAVEAARKKRDTARRLYVLTRQLAWLLRSVRAGASLPLAVAFSHLALVYAPGCEKRESKQGAVTLLKLLWSAFTDTLVLGSVVGDVAGVPAWCGNQL
jgi:hypothetical protein